MTERVDALINRVMKSFPGVSALAQSRYYEEVHQELAPLAREIERQRDDFAARIEWLVKRLSYMEHSDHSGTPCVNVKFGCYWPQTMDEGMNPSGTAIEEYADLSLIAYIDAQIALEEKP